jgi:two-component system chemotaxis response regulator CheB
MIRVLVVEDSVVERKTIAAILNNDPDIEIVGEAVDGVEGVELTAQLKPDVITMDINMPRMNGHEATKRIMATMPTPIIVVTSVTYQEMVHRGLDILLAGAVEIIQKPSGSDVQDIETFNNELIAKVKAVSRIKFPRRAGDC